ncbi:MAG: phosphatidylglycerophosphatase A [Acidobacteriota bacterium]
MRASLARLLATVGTLGERLPAPGTTVGSPVGLALFLAVAGGSPARLAWAWAGLAVLAPLSVWACGGEAARRGEEDPGAVVLDEVAGQWLALAVLATCGGTLTASSLALSFLLFRLFDILKPWPIRALERLPGGAGIVADDLAAGAAAGLVVASLPI